MEIKVATNLEALTALFLKLGYTGKVAELINTCAYTTIRRELGDALTKEGIEYRDTIKGEEAEALAELREVLRVNMWFFKNIEFMNGGLKF